MKKKPKKSTLRNTADKLCGQIARSIGHCEHCGSSDNLQWAHIITRSIVRLRYERKNWYALCASCHRHFHNKPLQFSDFVAKTKGKNIVDELIRESNELMPITVEWYQKKIEELNKQI